MKIAGKKKLGKNTINTFPTVDEAGGNKWGCFRSCFLQSAAPYTEGIAYKILKNDLGIDLREAPGHTSCGAIGYHGGCIQPGNPNGDGGEEFFCSSSRTRYG